MAYHFRKLRQTLRLIPSTKSIGFSTRVNEGDQTKSVDGSTSPVNVQCADQMVKSVLGHGEGLTISGNTLPISCTILRSPSDSDLLNHLEPALETKLTNLPVTYKDLIQILLPKSAELISATDEDLSSFQSLVKSVNFTSDDILVQPMGSFDDDNSNTAGSHRERITVDVLRPVHFSTFTNHTNLPVRTSTGLDSVVINKHSIQTFTRDSSSVIQPQTHLYCSAEGAGGPPRGNNGPSKDGPSPEQMHEAKEKLEELVCHLFKGRHNYEMLHQNVVMENNLFGDNKSAIGVTAYKLELLKLRLRIHALLFSTSMEILSITTMEQNGVIRIHWRLKGLPQIQNLKFWRLFQKRESIAKEDWEWLEAFSYFHIGKDGLVHKHRIDRMMPDQELEPDLTEKLRGLLNPAKPLVS